MNVLRILLVLLIIFYVLERIDLISVPFMDDVMHYVFNVILLLLSTLVIIPVLSSIMLKGYNSKHSPELQRILNELDPNHNIGIKVTKKFITNNAVVFYQGRKPMMIIGESLAKKFNSEELKFILAHELHHIQNKDIMKNVLSFAAAVAIVPAVLLILLGNVFVDLIPVVPGIIIIVVIGLGSFISHFYFSQKRELAADRFALSFVSKDTALTVMKELRRTNSIPEKSFSPFATHPSVKKRLEAISSHGDK